LNEFKNFVQTNGGLVIWKIIPENSQITLSEFQNLPANTYPIVSIIDNFKKVNAEVLDSFVNLVNQTNMEMVLICIALDNNFTALEDDRKAQQIESILESNIGGSLVKLVVSPLKEKETIQLMGSMVNWKGGIEKIGHAIHEKTGGDPFLIGSLMGSLLQQRCLKRVSLSWELEPAWFDKINAPECYVSQIKERLKRLSPESLNLIKIASVLGKEFESDILREITGYSDEETLKHLKEIFLQRLVQ
jgi:predicted ATPase